MLGRLAAAASLLLAASCAGQPFVYVPFQHERVECPVAGQYSVAGKTPDGADYSGQAVIVGTAAGCFLRWTGTNNTYGPGKFMVGMLKVNYTRAGRAAVADFRRTRGDGLKGEWHYVDDAGRKGTETLTWIKPQKAKPAETAKQ